MTDKLRVTVYFYAGRGGCVDQAALERVAPSDRKYVMADAGGPSTWTETFEGIGRHEAMLTAERTVRTDHLHAFVQNITCEDAA